jgi:hypothetical protein
MRNHITREKSEKDLGAGLSFHNKFLSEKLRCPKQITLISSEGSVPKTSQYAPPLKGISLPWHSRVHAPNTLILGGQIQLIETPIVLNEMGKTIFFNMC